MKVAFDYQIFSCQRFGGISRYFFELAYHLSVFKRDKISCLINSPIYVNEYLRHSNEGLRINGVAFPAIPKSCRAYRVINQLISPKRITGWRPDIVHETYYSSRSVAPPGCPVVVTVFDMIHELYPEYFPSRDQTREHKKIAVDRADHIICISENTKKDLIHLLGVPPEKMSVIHLGFALAQTSQVAQHLQIRPFILYVGHRGGYKNFKKLLSAYASHPQLRDVYDLIAFGGGDFNRQELEMIRNLHLQLTHVRHMSGGDGALADLYRQAAMFVYPSLYEGFGMPPLEAMSFNCPVACSDTSSMPEVVGNAAIQFDPLDIDSIAHALLRLTSDSALRANMIDLGASRVKNFSWEQCATQTLNVYQSLLQ